MVARAPVSARARRAVLGAVLPTLCLLAGCAGPGRLTVAEHAPDAYVVLGADGLALARVLSTRQACGDLELDGRSVPMQLRARAETIPQRPTRSLAEDSKPSVFAEATCELPIPPGTQTARFAGRDLPLPKPVVGRIVVIGDTGCRIKVEDRAFQACREPDQYPFAEIAERAAQWHPDLVIHVGDYLYRENACPNGHPGCAGSAWGYGSDSWHADFFDPARALLAAAPWVMARGNHESCARAGQGWWRYFDAAPLVPGRDCNAAVDDEIGDFSAPYAVPLGDDAQLIVFDSSAAPAGLPPADGHLMHEFATMVQSISALATRAGHSIGIDHHPILGFAAVENPQHEVELRPGNAALQAVFGNANEHLFPGQIDVLLAGHVHVWEQLSFAGRFPSQFIVGFSGTAEDKVPLPAVLPENAMPAPGARVETFSSWVGGFGYMTLERTGNASWDVRVWSRHGVAVNRCQIEGRLSACEHARID